MRSLTLALGFTVLALVAGCGPEQAQAPQQTGAFAREFGAYGEDLEAPPDLGIAGLAAVRDAWFQERWAP